MLEYVVISGNEFIYFVCGLVIVCFYVVMLGGGRFWVVIG